MNYQVVIASNIAKKAMRKANNRQSMSPDVWKKKKFAMRQYKKMLKAKKNINDNRNEKAFSKYIDRAIFVTIGLAALSVIHPQVGILAVIFAIFIVAAIMDTKIRNASQKAQKESDKRMEKILRFIHNENKNKAIEAKSIPAARLPKRSIKTTQKKLNLTNKEEIQEETNLHELPQALQETITEFPYKNIPN